MDTVMSVLVGLVLLAALACPLIFLIRLVACLFSQEIRRRVRSHPWQHVLWALLSVLLLTMLLPASSGPHGKSKGMQTLCTAKALECACSAFLMEYGRFPLQAGTNDHTYTKDQSLLIAVLRGQAGKTTENPRQLVFIDVPDDQISASGRLFDGWGHPFNIIADWSGDGSVTVGTNVVRRQVAVWSNGPDGKNDFGSGDDVKAW